MVIRLMSERVVCWISFLMRNSPCSRPPGVWGMRLWVSDCLLLEAFNHRPKLPRVSHVDCSHPKLTGKMLSYPKIIMPMEFSMNFGDCLYLCCGTFLYKRDNKSKTSNVCFPCVHLQSFQICVRLSKHNVSTCSYTFQTLSCQGFYWLCC